jgi:hypothetical protein
MNERVDELDDEEVLHVTDYDEWKKEKEFRKQCRQVARNERLRLAVSFCTMNHDRAMKLGQALVGNTTLRQLQVSLSSSLSIRAAQVLATGIQQAKLIRLSVKSISTQSPQVVQALLVSIQQSPAIQELHMESQSHSCEVKGILTSLHSLCELSICGMCHLKSLCDGLQYTTSLKKLKLVYRGLGDDGMKDLSIGLSKNSSITCLQLQSNRIGDVGVAAFVEHWKPDSCLEELNLSGNDIGQVGALTLLQAIQSDHPCLQELDLSSNINVGYLGLQAIGQQLCGESCLRKLALSNCGNWIFSRNRNSRKARAQEKIRKAAGQALLKGIQRNRLLHQLDVSFNKLGYPVENVIGLYAALNRHGRHLLSVNGGIPPSAWCQILENCQQDCHPTSILYYLLREQPNLMSTT